MRPTRLFARPRGAAGLPLAMTCALLMAGCQEATAPTSPAPDGVPCVGATAQEAAIADEHALIFKGLVQAPPAPEGAGGRAALDWLVPPAHAFALETERPVADATVALAPVTGPGLALGEPARQTRTDAQGRYCVRLPRGASPGGSWALVAEHPGRGLELRQVAFHGFDANLNSQSEALARVLAAEEIDTRAMDPARWLNLRTVSDTAVGLFGGFDPEGLGAGALIEAMERALRVSRRASATLLLGGEPR